MNESEKNGKTPRSPKTDIDRILFVMIFLYQNECTRSNAAESIIEKSDRRYATE